MKEKLRKIFSFQILFSVLKLEKSKETVLKMADGLRATFYVSDI